MSWRNGSNMSWATQSIFPNRVCYQVLCYSLSLFKERNCCVGGNQLLMFGRQPLSPTICILIMPKFPLFTLIPSRWFPQKYSLYLPLSWSFEALTIESLGWGGGWWQDWVFERLVPCFGGFHKMVPCVVVLSRLCEVGLLEALECHGAWWEHCLSGSLISRLGGFPDFWRSKCLW